MQRFKSLEMRAFPALLNQRESSAPIKRSEPLHNPPWDAKVWIGMGHRAPLTAHSSAIWQEHLRSGPPEAAPESDRRGYAAPPSASAVDRDGLQGARRSNGLAHSSICNTADRPRLPMDTARGCVQRLPGATVCGQQTGCPFSRRKKARFCGLVHDRLPVQIANFSRLSF